MRSDDNEELQTHIIRERLMTKGGFIPPFGKHKEGSKSFHPCLFSTESEVKHMIKSLSAEHYALANENADELVRFVLREESDVRQQSLIEWMSHEMIEEFVIPNIPVSVRSRSEKRQYVKTVFAVFKVRLLERIKQMDPNWKDLLDEE